MQLGTPYPLTAIETEPLAFYAVPGPLTDPGPHAALFDRLPPELPALVKIVQGVLLPVAWVERHGVSLTDERRAEVDLRAVADLLSRLQTLSPGPLTAPRAPEERLIASARHFAVLLTALLRDQGLPSRARCGFANDLMPGSVAEHWICEYWDAASTRWIAVDPLNVTADRFLPAGRAWQMACQGGIDPGRLGGLDLIRATLLRDLAALNKVEPLPRDRWGLIDSPGTGLSPADLALLDHVAGLTLGGNDAFADLRRVYTTDARLTVPDDLSDVPHAAIYPIAA